VTSAWRREDDVDGLGEGTPARLEGVGAVRDEYWANTCFLEPTECFANVGLPRDMDFLFRAPAAMTTHRWHRTNPTLFGRVAVADRHAITLRIEAGTNM
jgi:hypothetical protein